METWYRCTGCTSIWDEEFVIAGGKGMKCIACGGNLVLKGKCEVCEKEVEIYRKGCCVGCYAKMYKPPFVVDVTAEELLIEIENGINNCYDYKAQLKYNKKIREKIENYFSNKSEEKT